MTEQEIAEAEAEVEAAEAKLDAAEQYHAEAGGQRSHQEFRVAQAEANGARDRVRRLRSTWARERAAEGRREAAEAAFAPKADAVAAKLAAARDGAAEAVAEAQAAVGRMLDVVAAYDDTVRAVAGELKGRGLSADNGELLGGTSVGGVRLAGEVWAPVGAADLLAAVMASAVGSRHRQHPLAGLRWQHAGGLPTKTARAELLRRAVR
ncbi:hypothetical protein [Streptomyces scabiei]|uniref:hypothetical protein n=1 Tax=Streptomyces scabiei TaxID=1930 RepID=UPI0029A1C2F8|nr:hypothetical protein [Streptomyces scabiei]MDX3279101.1 hypothetical protein [Streptomyces scabiei]